MQQHRWLCCVGGASQVDWLLDEVDHAFAQGHLSPPPPTFDGGLLRFNPRAPPYGVAGFDRTTNRGWFARSLAFSSQERFVSTFNVDARRVHHRELSGASVVEAIHEAMLDIASKAANLVESQLPTGESDLYRFAHRRPHRACGPWLAEEGWVGHTRAGDAVAAVLRRHYALAMDFGTPASLAQMDKAEAA